MLKHVCRPFSLLAIAGAAVIGLHSAPVQADEVDDLTKAAADYAAGKYAQAAVQFFDIAEGSGTNPEVQYRAESFLAQSLFKLGLYHSALYYDRTIIEVGPAHPYYVQAVENTLDVMDAVGDKAIIPSLLDQEYNENFARLPKGMIDRVNFIVAFWGHQQKRTAESIDFLDAVKPDSAQYPRARYLRAVQLAQESKSGESEENEEAAKFFLEVLKLKDGKTKYADLQELKELSTLGLARVRYAQGKYQEAYELYAQVPRFSRLWRDALFEGAYAAFMNNEYGKALGMLHTLHAPVAGDQFIPESWLLKAHIYYFSCLFDESKSALTRLQQDYPKTGEEVKELVDAKLDPDHYYELLITGAKGELKLPVNVRNELLKDEGLRGRRSYVAALALEEKKLETLPEFKGKLLQAALLEAVRDQRVSLMQAAGKSVRQALAKIQFALEDMDGQADIVRFEMAKREKDLFEASHDSESVLGAQYLARPAMPTHGIEYWDFEGEFWPDELGYYRFTLKNACPADERMTTTADKQ